MVDIVPTITAANPHVYRTQLELREQFAERLHLDLAEGDFAPTELIPISQVYWSAEKTIDMHMMVHDPGRFVNEYISLKPSLLIVHVEAKDGELSRLDLFDQLKPLDIKVGVCIMAGTEVGEHEDLIKAADHVLIFAGNLGYQGGQADMSCTKKITQIRTLNPEAEIGWDGGVNADNAAKLIESGVDVLNVGGFIAKSDAPQEAYAILEQIIKSGGKS